MKLRKYQQDIINSVRAAIALGAKRILVSAPTGSGKAQSVDSKILTPDGWTTFGKIKVGDYINNSYGEVSQVKGVYPQGIKDSYEVEFSDGSKTICCEEHLWSVQTRDSKKFNTLSLRQIIDRGYKRTYFDKRYGTNPTDYKFSIPNHNITLFKGKDLPLHPYVLGTLLGDGCFRGGMISLTNSEESVVNKIKELLPKTDRLSQLEYNQFNVVRKVRSNSKSETKKIIENSRLDNHLSYDKFIPKKYLFNTADKRIELLRGLLDADGSVSKGRIEYSTSSEQLKDDIVSLVRSLGGYVTCSDRVPKYTYKGELKTGRKSYRVYISFSNGVVPVSSKKHLKKYKQGSRRRRNIVNIKKLKPVEMICISTTAIDELYLTDDFIVTHNTFIAKNIMTLSRAKGKKVLFTVPLTPLIEQTYDEFGKDGISIIRGNDKRYNPNADVHVGTIQTLNNRELPDVDVVILDEVHYGHGAKMLTKILEHYKEKVVIGLSATPITEKGFLLPSWDKYITKLQTIDLIEQGFLCRYDMYIPFELDLSKVSIQAGDYSTKEVEPIANAVMSNVVQEWERVASDRKTISFCNSIESAEIYASKFRALGVRVGTIHQRVPEAERQILYQAFDNNSIQMLLNVNVLTAGFNQKDVDCILLTRPTKVLRTYIQMVGRGLRAAEGKESCLFIDCANNIKEHGEPALRRTFYPEPVFGEVLDRKRAENKEDCPDKIKPTTPEEAKQLKKIGRYLDIFKDTVYMREQDLLEDVMNFLNKMNLIRWRQNSGAMPDNTGRWVHFTSMKGLPDITTLQFCGIYVGIELKIKNRPLRPTQLKTHTDMIQRGQHLFIAQTVEEVFDICEHIRINIREEEDSYIVSKEIYNVPERQKEYRKKFKLPERYES